MRWLVQEPPRFWSCCAASGRARRPEPWWFLDKLPPNSPSVQCTGRPAEVACPGMVVSRGQWPCKATRTVVVPWQAFSECTVYRSPRRMRWLVQEPPGFWSPSAASGRARRPEPWWFLDKLHPECTVYRSPRRMRWFWSPCAASGRARRPQAPSQVYSVQVAPECTVYRSGGVSISSYPGTTTVQCTGWCTVYSVQSVQSTVQCFVRTVQFRQSVSVQNLNSESLIHHRIIESYIIYRIISISYQPYINIISYHIISYHIISYHII